MRQFHVATVMNNPGQYAAMRESMATVGFDEDTCRFTVFDNTAGNRHDPYAVLRQLGTDGDEPYVILCHQDLLFGPDTSHARLVKVLAELTARSPRWAVAGDAGYDRFGRGVFHLTDPYGVQRMAGLPRRVVSLDENFLVLPRARYTAPSADLSGFHFYATDVCLQAYLRRRTAHVIDFPVTHLSGGTAHGVVFEAAKEAFADRWQRRVLVIDLRLPATEVVRASGPWVSRVFLRHSTRPVRRWLGIPVVLRRPRWWPGGPS